MYADRARGNLLLSRSRRWRRTPTDSIWLYLTIYFVGVILGVGANVLLEIRLHKPALSRQIVLAVFGIVIGVIIFQWSTAPEQWIVLLLWGVTGVLCGLGSRESREPLT